jgi:FKBP-type peptidyl-prolyl cis-trans isomerase FklB
MTISFKHTAMVSLVAASLFSSSVFAETAPADQSSPVLAPSVDTTAPDMNKISYILGYQMGGAAESQGVDLQADAFSDGVKAGVQGIASKYSDEESKAAMDAFQQYMENKMMNKQNQMADQNQKASNDFMVKIAQEPGVIKISDGLYYKVLTAGTGAIPTSKDKVKVNYEGSLIDGTVFDSSYKRGTPISFGVTQVIPGWTQALQKMPVGSTWMVYISPELAYGIKSK